MKLNASKSLYALVIFLALGACGEPPAEHAAAPSAGTTEPSMYHSLAQSGAAVDAEAARDMISRSAPGKIVNIASLLSFQGGIRVPALSIGRCAVRSNPASMRQAFTPRCRLKMCRQGTRRWRKPFRAGGNRRRTMLACLRPMLGEWVWPRPMRPGPNTKCIGL